MAKLLNRYYIQGIMSDLSLSIIIYILRGENWGREKVNNLPNIIQLIS